MKRLFIPLVLLIVLAGIALLVIMNLDSGEQDADFSISNRDKVGSIFIADRSNKTVLLKRTDDDHWTVNDQFPARTPEVNGVLSALEKLDVRRPVSKNAIQNVIADMATNNTKVEVYDRHGDLMLGFLIGAPPPDNIGNYAKKEDSRDLYIIEIPGFDGTLHTRFHTDMVAWRDRAIFRYAPYEVAKVKLDYPNEPGQSFQIMVVKRDSFAFKPLSPEAPSFVVEPNKRMIGQYINEFREVHAEAYVNEFGGRDSIVAQGPYLVMTVTDTAGHDNVIKLFRKPVGKRTKEQFDPKGNLRTYDTERSYALIHNGKDFVLVQQFAFGKLVRDYSSFFQPF